MNKQTGRQNVFSPEDDFHVESFNDHSIDFRGAKSLN